MLSVVIVDKAGRRPLLLAGVSGIVSAPLLPSFTSSFQAKPADECWRSSDCYNLPDSGAPPPGADVTLLRIAMEVSMDLPTNPASRS